MAVNQTEKFEFWVQRVLPQVYDDSLSYMELLNKVVHFLNEVISQTNELTTFTENELKQMRADILSFLTAYDTKLSDTVEATLDAWQTSGRLDVIIADALKWEFDTYKAATDAQVTRNKKASVQPDFGATFINRSYTATGIRKTSASEIELFAQNDRKGTRYLLVKDPNDEFYKLGIGTLYDCVGATTITTKGSGWVTGTSNPYTTAVGDSYSFTYTGTSAEVTFLTDNRGGMFEVRVDGQFYKNVTVYAAVSVDKKITIDAPFGAHTVEFIFLGQDPQNPVASPRGWAKGAANAVVTFGTLARSNPIDLLHPTSNKEFAFSVQFNGQSFWFPEHNGVGTMFDNVISVQVDNVTINFPNLAIGDVVMGKVITVQQSFAAYDNTKVTKLANMKTMHEIDLTGFINFSGVMVGVVPFNIVVGYPLMLPTNAERLNIAKTSFFNQKMNDGDSTEYYFTDEQDQATSAVFTTNVSGNGSYGAFGTVLYPSQTMRYGESGKPTPSESMFFWQRPTIPKIYFQSLANKVFDNTDTYKWSGKIGVGVKQSIATYL